jgi:hypothetical protein
MLEKLINASNEWIEIANELEENGGELTPDLEKRFEVSVNNMADVSDQLANTLDYVDTAIAVAKKKKDRYQYKQKQFENFKDRIRDTAKLLMMNGVAFQGEDRKVILTKETKVLNVDNVDINKLENKDKYTKVVISLDKTKLKKDIKNGVIDMPEGAYTTQERTLQVR